MRTRSGATELSLILRTSPQLLGGLPTTASPFREGKVVAVVTLSSDEMVELERPVLATGVRPKPIEHDVFGGREPTCATMQTFVEKHALATQSLGEALDRGVGDFESSRDLSVSRARNFESKDGFQEIRAPQPVGGGEGLSTEGPVTRRTAETLDPQRGSRSGEVAGPFVGPTLWIQMEFAARVWAERRRCRGGGSGHDCPKGRNHARNNCPST